MPLDPNARTVVTGLNNAPDFTHGLVRDIRIRWALEEIGRPYRTRLFDAMAPRPADYRDWHPFNQVPALDDGEVRLFESGAILLYLGDQDERLLPRDAAGRWQATAWLIGALNSVEPTLMQIVSLDIFLADEPWAKAARPSAVEAARWRLAPVAEALGDREWLTGRFTVADIMMVTVLRSLGHTDLVGDYPKLAAYQARGEARPAFQRALADQAADLGEPARLDDRV
jgi:glutathione S-transferase